MKTILSTVLDQFSSSTNTSVRQRGEAKILEAEKCGLRFRVTVPDDVLEWFVDVLDGSSVVVHDWADYEGYDDSPRDELALLMTKDVTDFVTTALSSDIRLSKVHKKQIMEWKIGNAWMQAVPLVPT